MMELIVYFLGSIGLTTIVTMSNMFEPVRRLFYVSLKEEYSKKEKISIKIYELLNCPLCFGFWAGFVVYFIMMIPYVGYPFTLALGASCISYLYSRII